jgi:opacity protein-like surface antigen
VDIFANPRSPILALSICKYKKLFNGFGVAVTSVGSNSDVRFGWAVGAGVEGKITNNWSAKLEYLYVDFDTFRAEPSPPRRPLRLVQMSTRNSMTTSCASA